MVENDRQSWGAVECLFCPFDGAKYDEAATTCKICGNMRAMVVAKLGSNESSADIVTLPGCIAVPAWSSNSFVLEKSRDNQYKVNVWRKVLYAKQPFPDDYTDTKRFLDCLVQNAKPPRYGYWYLVSLTGRIVQPICIVVIHIAVWRGVDRQPSRISATTLTFIDFALISLYWLGTWWTKKPVDLMDQHPSTDGSMTAFKRITVIIGCLKVLSPLLQTLTQSFSHDTVICLTVVLFLIHLVSFDHQRVFLPVPYNGGAVALNASIVGTTLLVSRLRDSDQVFAVLLFGVFALILTLPLRRSVYLWKPWVHDVGLTGFLTIVSLILVHYFVDNTVLMITYIATLMVLLFMGPALYLLNVKYKSNLSGPWDVPVIVLPD